VRDVLAHLIGIIEDAVAGRLSGPPPPEMTAEQVDRHRDDDPRELLATWEVGAPLFEPALTERALWPAFFDVLSHELDVRSALGRTDERDSDDVRLAARLGAEGLPPQIEIDLDGSSRPGPPAEGVARLSASSFEVLRLRLGRRSRAQVLALDWTGDPKPHLDDLFVFGPRDTDLVE
jgi:uncharacterized protein (TIGR03083 family)